MSALVIEGFAGPGGWSEGLRLAGFSGTAVGFELDDVACRTAQAAGHQRARADVATFPLDQLAGKVDGLIMSPPCQAWSNAGEQLGKLDQTLVFERITAFARGDQPPGRTWADERSRLTAEPMRWTHALRPRWIALEQVPPVLPLWRYIADVLRAKGYRAWAGILSAEQYGVPQTRKRAILLARRDGLVAAPPLPTHRAYRAGRDADADPDLFGDVLPPPVSMAEALGWSVDGRPLADVVMRNGNQDNACERRACERRACEPAGTLFFGQRTNAVDWVMRSNYTDRRSPSERGERTPDESAATVTGKVKGAKWVRQTERQANGGARSVEDPSLTITASLDNGNMRWTAEPRMHPAGVHGSYGYSRAVTDPSPTIKGAGSGGQYVSDGEDTARVTVKEAAVLQSFRLDYPWQGTKSQQYRQVGDAVPPLLAAAVLRQFVDTNAGRCAA